MAQSCDKPEARTADTQMQADDGSTPIKDLNQPSNGDDGQDLKHTKEDSLKKNTQLRFASYAVNEQPKTAPAESRSIRSEHRV